uniref:Translation initiation factor IF-1, chloroplastic n=1 Tax=Entransia fimbriata TaxID=130991 RepID=A0A191T4N7_9VIRI|nr:translational initiation factor 1 [Entransia fimbriata]ANI25355.1 translational initiation factor 1 [Entransia fimbriata]WKT05794.1 translation initiation factor 1 [Entransia fimbriata]WKT05913.1 translation initiation factor 1 [Entransia fimbriata]
MKKQRPIDMEGVVIKSLSNGMFRVCLDNEHEVLAHISGKIRRNKIEIYLGDRVRIEISPYDLTRARIIYRLPRPLEINTNNVRGRPQGAVL